MDRIQVEHLIKANDRRKAGVPSGEDISLLEKYGITDKTGRLCADNYQLLVSLENSDVVSLIAGKLEKHSTGTPFVSLKGSTSEEVKKDEIGDDINQEFVSTSTEAQLLVCESNYALDEKKIREELETFLKKSHREGEGYKKGDVKIMHFDQAAQQNPELLIAAGTKVLDALLFCALVEDETKVGMFHFVSVSKLNSLVISKNLEEARRAILAALVLVWTQGGLPSEVTQSRSLSKFVRNYIYGGKVENHLQIAQQLSSTSTLKFPCSVFLDVKISELDQGVASRCKLSVAGNRPVRYAIYSADCEKQARRTVVEGMTAVDIQEAMTRNERIDLARSIVDFLVSLQGNTDAQARMHPQRKDRPVVKDLSLMLTRAIIENLSVVGRYQLVRKVDDERNSAFTLDTGYYGVVMGEERVWPILTNARADFRSLSLAALKGYYKML
uniref:Coat protein n=1 Tax=Rhododendron ophiovirus TaxID=2983957 RepID=A0A9N6YJQ1_9VIRU|nr:TPA_asm: coat protein [Rhododendron ophiovirus]